MLSQVHVFSMCLLKSQFIGTYLYWDIEQLDFFQIGTIVSEILVGGGGRNGHPRGGRWSNGSRVNGAYMLMLRRYSDELVIRFD